MMDIAEYDTLDEVLLAMSQTERSLALIALQEDGLWDGRILDNE